MFLLGEVLLESPDDRPLEVRRHRPKARTVFSSDNTNTQQSDGQRGWMPGWESRPAPAALKQCCLFQVTFPMPVALPGQAKHHCVPQHSKVGGREHRVQLWHCGGVSQPRTPRAALPAAVPAHTHSCPGICLSPSPFHYV